MIDLIDISSIQWPVDFRKVKEAGFRGVYVKSSQYTSIRDGRFDAFVHQAKEEGLAVGAYHFCSQSSAGPTGGYQMTEPDKQMGFFFHASQGIGSKPGELPPMIDWEFCTKPTSKECVDWLEVAVVYAERLWYPQNDSVKARNEPTFIERLPVVYTYPDFARRHQPELGQRTLLGRRPLCYASYKSEYLADKREYRLVPWYPKEGQQPLHKLPSPWTKATLWQYSGNNGLAVPGVSVDCDRQIFLGTEGEWKEFLGLPRPKSFFEGEDIQ